MFIIMLTPGTYRANTVTILRDSNYIVPCDFAPDRSMYEIQRKLLSYDKTAVSIISLTVLYYH